MPIDHELRKELNDELHGRAGMPVSVPATIIHLTYTIEHNDQDPVLAIIALCKAMKQKPPQPDALHFAMPVIGGHLRFERHGEFYRINLLRKSESPDDPFVGLPKNWIEELPGKRLVAIRTSLVQKQKNKAADSVAQKMFGHDDVAASVIGQGEATIWMDFRIGPDGFTQILVENTNMSPLRMGRALRRIHEIETYRMMALLALPVARKLLPEINDLEQRLARTVEAMAQGQGTYEDAALLEQLSTTSRDVESISSRSNYRFSASRAYSTLVSKRIAELNEERVKNHQRIGVFVDRRFSPAMATCQAVADRITSLTLRCERASNLLRTRVDIALEGQNQQLLTSMNNRAQQQLKLQETVEGLSIVAISYYLSGLIFKMFDGVLHELGPTRVNVINMTVIPIVALCVWLVMKRVKSRLNRKF